jgi:CubicO group peptidase (beta-lactamase class C family)
MEWDYAALEVGEEIPTWGDTRSGFRCLVPTVWPVETWPTQDWITSTPAEQGMDPELIAKGIAQLKSTFQEPHSLLIIRHGFLVVEEYYRGYRPTQYQDVASVNKSFLSALIGIAIEQGAIPGIDQRMMDYFPEYATPELDPRAYEVTIEDLLTMTSGFDWPEKEPIAPAFINEAFSSGMPQNTLLRSKIVAEPGSTFNYCTACTHVLSIILQEATGIPAQEFAQEYLMTPLGISPDDWDWDEVGLGYNSGGWGFYLTPRDMAKLGYLYLNNGNWDGNQIIPEEWVRTSRQKLVDLGQHQGYGYLWWTTMLDGHPAYYANGHGGQYIYVLPTLDLVVVVTQETDSHNGGDPAEIIQDYFALAVLNP